MQRKELEEIKKVHQKKINQRGVKKNTHKEGHNGEIEEHKKITQIGNK